MSDECGVMSDGNGVLVIGPILPSRESRDGEC